MHLSISHTIPLLLCTIYTTTYAQATLCTSTNAISFESLQTDNSGSGSGGVDFEFEMEHNDFLNDLQGQSNENLNAGGNSFLNAAGRSLGKRDDLSCTATESCMSISNIPFCVHTVSGDYHLEGETGNLITGDWTNSNGDTGNLYTGASSTASAGTASETGTRGAASSTQTPNSAVRRMNGAGGLVGGAVASLLGMLML